MHFYKAILCLSAWYIYFHVLFWTTTLPPPSHNKAGLTFSDLEVSQPANNDKMRLYSVHLVCQNHPCSSTTTGRWWWMPVRPSLWLVLTIFTHCEVKIVKIDYDSEKSYLALLTANMLIGVLRANLEESKTVRSWLLQHHPPP